MPIHADHIRHFRAAAREFQVWLLVRDTNEASLQYVAHAQRGEPYYPKPIDCKPKTADGNSGGRQHAGLVVDPTLAAGSFTDDKRAKALKEWDKWHWRERLNPDKKDEPKFTKTEEGGFFYKVDLDEKSKHYGCLMRGESRDQLKYLFGDYDLKDVVDPKHPRGNLAAIETLNGQLHMRGPKVLKVMEFVNQRIGVPMLQHGGDAQARAHDTDEIHVFTRWGNYRVLNTKTKVERLYAGLRGFQGRVTLDAGPIAASMRADEELLNSLEGNITSTYVPWTPVVIPGGQA